jgi:hypothetical protein
MSRKAKLKSSRGRSKANASELPDPSTVGSLSSPIPVAKTTVWGILIAGCFVAYLVVFSQQPASLPITDSDGQTANRLTELFVMADTVPGIVGYGNQKLGFADRLPIIAASLAWLAAAYRVGLCFVRPLFRQIPLAVQVSIATLAGLALLSSLTLAVGLLGGLHSRWPLLIAVLGLLILSWLIRPLLTDDQLKKGDGDLRQQPQEILAPQSIADVWVRRWIILLTSMLVMVYVLGGALPAWEFDVLEYHLQAPKEFFQQGFVGFVRGNVYANMPLGIEMHSLAWMALVGGEDGWLWGGVIGKTIISSYTLLTALLLGGLLAGRFGATCGWAGAGLFLATAGNLHVSLAGLIDVALAAYVTATLVTLIRVWPRLQDGSLGIQAALLLGVLAGGAGACKYTGLLLVVVPTLCVALFCPFCFGNRRVFGPAIVGLALGVTLTALPWLAKNAVLIGNPVYPLASDWFPTPEMSATQLENWQRVHRPQPVDGSSAYSIMAAYSSIRQLLLASPFLNPSLLFLFAAGVLTLSRDQQLRSWKLAVGACLVVFWVLSTWWLFTHRIDRFWLPAVPSMVIIASVGMVGIARRTSSLIVTGIVLLGMLYGSLQVLSGAAINDNRFLVALSELDAKWTSDRQDINNNTVAWINSELEPKSKVLSIGELKVYPFRVPVIYATCFNRQPAEQWLASKSAEEQRDALKREGVTHLLVAWSEIDRYRRPDNYGFADWPDRGDIKQMLDDGVLERVDTPFDPQDVELFEVQWQ